MAAGDDLISDSEEGYLNGQLLIAMPSMRDPRFERTVVYLCVHNADGAMGLVINRMVGSLTFNDLLEQLEIETGEASQGINVRFGGPVESGRGFVLHSAEYMRDGTLQVSDTMALTTTIDVLRDIAKGQGPSECMLALGYAGWGPGQLDSEIQANGWLHVEADHGLVFGENLDEKWQQAIAKLGFDASMLSGEAGHA